MYLKKINKHKKNGNDVECVLHKFEDG